MIIMILNVSKSFSEQVPSAEKEDRFPPCLYIHTTLKPPFLSASQHTAQSSCHQASISLTLQHTSQSFPLFLSPTSHHHFSLFKFNWLSMFLLFLPQSTAAFPLYTPHIKSRVDSGCCLTSTIILFTSLLIQIMMQTIFLTL